VEDLPVVHEGDVPEIDVSRWTLRIYGLVEEEVTLDWEAFRSLPRVEVVADLHCAEGWSCLDILWDGVSVQEVVSRARPLPAARFVIVRSEGGWTTNMPVENFIVEDNLFAVGLDGEPLPPEHGGPVRLVVPRLYAWKSAKWVRAVEFVETDVPGTNERLGFHTRGDPWLEEKYGTYC
jgi:DMSO/TMAO reductase YedYZ molybdopterin-dependent catalytic subunit